MMDVCHSKKNVSITKKFIYTVVVNELSNEHHKEQANENNTIKARKDAKATLAFASNSNNANISASSTFHTMALSV